MANPDLKRGDINGDGKIQNDDVAALQTLVNFNRK